MPKNKQNIDCYFSMHILNTSTDEQIIYVKPRKTAASGSTTLTLTDKSTRVSTDYAHTYQYSSSSNTGSISVTFSTGDLKAETYYTFTLKDTVGEIYRGIIYVTNQTDYPKYEVGKGDYVTEDSYDNDFIII